MISNTSSTHGTPPAHLPPERTRKTAAAAPAGSESLSTSHLENLRSALAASPEVRAEVVERGHNLAVDPNYPPREIIEDVARLITESEDLTAGE